MSCARNGRHSSDHNCHGTRFLPTWSPPPQIRRRLSRVLGAPSGPARKGQRVGWLVGWTKSLTRPSGPAQLGAVPPPFPNRPTRDPGPPEKKRRGEGEGRAGTWQWAGPPARAVAHDAEPQPVLQSGVQKKKRAGTPVCEDISPGEPDLRRKGAKDAALLAGTSFGGCSVRRKDRNGGKGGCRPIGRRRAVFVHLESPGPAPPPPPSPG